VLQKFIQNFSPPKQFLGVLISSTVRTVLAGAGHVVKAVVGWSSPKIQTRGVFTSHANLKYFIFYLLHQIFRRMYEVLNIGKK
jgi:hypothetical protein